MYRNRLIGDRGSIDHPYVRPKGLFLVIDRATSVPRPYLHEDFRRPLLAGRLWRRLGSSPNRRAAFCAWQRRLFRLTGDPGQSGRGVPGVPSTPAAKQKVNITFLIYYIYFQMSKWFIESVFCDLVLVCRFFGVWLIF